MVENFQIAPLMLMDSDSHHNKYCRGLDHSDSHKFRQWSDKSQGLLMYY
jgi:hypothetical protein